jgi:hypothetical protein
MQKDITHITVVPDSKGIFDYQWGDIGQPLKSQGHQGWMIRCLGCSNLSPIDEDKIVKNEDGTASSREPLHCHGSKMRQRYSIDHNEVKWL